MGSLEEKKGEKDIHITSGQFCNIVNEQKLIDLFTRKGWKVTEVICSFMSSLTP